MGALTGFPEGHRVHPRKVNALSGNSHVSVSASNQTQGMKIPFVDETMRLDGVWPSVRRKGQSGIQLSLRAGLQPGRGERGGGPGGNSQRFLPSLGIFLLTAWSPVDHDYKKPSSLINKM